MILNGIDWFGKSKLQILNADHIEYFSKTFLGPQHFLVKILVFAQHPEWQNEHRCEVIHPATLLFQLAQDYMRSHGISTQYNVKCAWLGWWEASGAKTGGFWGNDGYIREDTGMMISYLESLSIYQNFHQVIHLGVSKNRGTPSSHPFIDCFSIINQPAIGEPPF